MRGGKIHQWLGDHLLSPHLWLFHRGPVARSLLIGLIICTSPFFGLHIITAMLLAMLLRANIPLTFGLQWLTNWFTVPIYYSLAYAFGCRLLGQEILPTGGWSRILDHPDLLSIFPPLFLGCTVIGVSSGLIGYALVYLFWKRPEIPPSSDLDPGQDTSRIL